MQCRGGIVAGRRGVAGRTCRIVGARTADSAYIDRSEIALRMCRRNAFHPHPRRADPQPAQHRPRAAARPADRDHRAVRVGQVLARVRHDLRRGPAPLRRVAVGLRAPVPVDDGKARRRLDRGPVAGDRDRAEVDLAQPALDRRHGHRDLRLPAPAVRARRHPALPGPRHRPAGADRQPDGRPGAAAAGRHADPAARAGDRRTQGRARARDRAAARPGFRARAHRRHRRRAR